MAAPVDWNSVVGPAVDVRRVFDSMPVAAVAYRGSEHRIIARNEYCRALFPKLAVIGAPLRDAVPELRGQFIFGLYDRVLQSGEQREVREWRVEVDLDGAGHLQEFFLDATLTARRSDDGEIDGVQAIFRDVTERVRQRRDAEARAATLARSYEQMRAFATEMQHALLAASVPVMPGFDIAAQYLVAAEDTAAGGDWFDAIATEDGALYLIVGDVVGHGVEAAAVMVQLRTAARMHILMGKTITETLDAVEDFSQHVRGARSATLCIGRLDSDSNIFAYCTAGHPPPLLVIDGAPRYAEPSGGGPLGSGHPYVAKIEYLDVGDTVVLYTDGLIQRPQCPFAAGVAEFADVVADILAGDGLPGVSAQRPVDRLCSQVLEALLVGGGSSDDVTVLVAQRTRPVAPLRLSVTSDVRSTPHVRGRLREWLASLGADDADVLIVEHAVSEYVDNAVQHAYLGGAGPVTIEAALKPDATLHVSVTDRGEWKLPDPDAAGCGLSMARSLVGGAQVSHGSEGTQATMTYRLSKAARVVTDPMTAHHGRQPGFSTDFVVHIEPDGLMIVGGDIDAVQAPLLARRINRHSHSGTIRLDVDLSLVTHLGSAAVRVLSDVHARADAQGAPVTFIAPPGSTAHHILTMVALPTSPG